MGFSGKIGSLERSRNSDLGGRADLTAFGWKKQPAELVTPCHRYVTLSVTAGFAGFRRGFSAQISWQAQNFRKAKYRIRGRCSAFARSTFLKVGITWQAHHFRRVRYRFRGRRSTFAWSSIELVAGAALSQGQVQISWQVHHFREVKCKIRSRRATFARSSKDFVARHALSQGQLLQPGLENRNF